MVTWEIARRSTPHGATGCVQKAEPPAEPPSMARDEALLFVGDDFSQTDVPASRWSIPAQRWKNVGVIGTH